ncbi:MAG: PAS domain S-box protein [Proteobacteria bacterium]|nr:PAS domain S-box protein [Pseudomonadota bacterium]MBU1738482.1 PAS domain S-box protein [Pseudomonadota bacterium]
MVGIIQDLTDGKSTKTALRDSGDLYRSLVESTSAVAWEMDMQSLKFTYVSPAVEKVLGYKPEEWADFDFWADRVHPGDRDQAVNFCMVETREGRDHEFEYRFIAADGDVVWIRDIVSLVHENGAVSALRGFFLDITALKETYARLDRSNKELEALVEERSRETMDLQKELLIQEKLAEVGRLAAGVRHDLRNPLGVISNSIYYLKMKLGGSGDEKVLKHLALIEKESDRCNEIISELLDFSKVMSPNKVETVMSAFLQEQLEVMNLSPGIVVRFACEDACLKAMIDPGQISRVVRNLVGNAVQAMAGEGELAVSCCRQGELVAMSFTDNGKGIPAGNLIRIFDPLFSTRENGMGMGLANVRNFVNLHGGDVEVISEEGHGATFTVRLPAS